jgi:ABC-type uncharacterized transport system involved in gliding motility auxiliary subunit
MKRLVGLLGWIGVLLVITAVVLRFARPETPQWSQRLALAGLVVTVLYALSQWRDMARSLSGRNVRYGSVAATSVMLVLAILVGLNWISNRQNKRWDLTAAGQFSLSDQTKQILAGLDQPMRIRVFYVNSAEEYRDRLQEYAYQSSQVSVDYVDARRNNVEARSLGIDTAPTIIIEYAGRTERATSVDEQALTNALKRAVEGRAKKVYFVQGHGEHDPADGDPAGYSDIAAALKTDNFETAPLTLAQQGRVPDDATVVVVAGPRTDLLASEVDALRAYLDRGGKAMLLINPPDKPADPPQTNLIALAREWGVDVGNNLVIDASGLGQLIGAQDAAVPVAMPVLHAITNNFRTMTAFPMARSVVPIEGGVNGRTAQTVLETSPESWAEADLAGVLTTRRTERNPDQGDRVGPVPIAAAVSIAAPNAPPPPATPEGSADTATLPKPETRVVVVGDSDFASNAVVGLQGNRDIFLNMANWVAQQEDMIAIRPRSPEDRPITMTADQSAYVFWFTLAIVPLLLFVNGFRVWWRKR